MASISSNGTGGGNWSATGSWTGGVVPVDGDDVTVSTGDTITVDQTITIGSDTGSNVCLTINGTLDVPYTIGADYSLTLKGDIAGTGEWKIGTSANPLANSSSYTISINASGTPANLKYDFTVPNTLTLNWYGANKTTHTNLNGNVSASASQIIVDSATNWKAGDILILIDRTDDTKIEEHTIDSGYTSGTTVDLTGTVTDAKTDGWEVINVTHNILLEPDNAFTTFVKFNDCTVYTHVLSNVMFKDLYRGVGQITLDIGNFIFDNSNNDVKLSIYKCYKTTFDNDLQIEEWIDYNNQNISIVFNNSRRNCSIGVATFIKSVSYALNVGSFFEFLKIGTLNLLGNNTSSIRGFFNNSDFDTINAYANNQDVLQIVGANFKIGTFNAENNTQKAIESSLGMRIKNFNCVNNGNDVHMDYYSGDVVIQNYTPSTNGINALSRGYVKVTNYNNVVDYNRTFSNGCIMESDSTTYRTTAPAIKAYTNNLYGNEVTFSLSGNMPTFYANSGKTVQLNLYSRKDATRTDAVAKIRITRGTDGSGLTETTEHDILPTATATWELKALSLGTTTSSGFISLDLIIERGSSAWTLNIDDITIVES